jgi:hypothetical protein
MWRIAQLQSASSRLRRAIAAHAILDRAATICRRSTLARLRDAGGADLPDPRDAAGARQKAGETAQATRMRLSIAAPRRVRPARRGARAP